MTTSPEFIVVGITAGVSGVFHVIGRVGDFTLHVGQVFDQLDEPHAKVPVNVRILAMKAYGHDLSTLSPGMTGMIDMTGEGIDLVRPGCVLVCNTVKEVSEQQTQVSQEA